MSTPSDDRIARLPKWARKYIAGLESRIDGCFEGEPLTRRENRMATRYPRYSIPAGDWRRIFQGLGKKP